MANTQRFVPVEADDTAVPAPAPNSTSGKGQRFVPVGPDDSPVVQQDEGSFLESTDKKITNSLASSPNEDPRAAFAKTLGREGYSAAKTALGFIPGVVESFTEPAQTNEEKKTMEEHPVVGRAATGLGRILVDPVKNAANWYGKANKGQIPNAYEQALSVAPEAVGQGAGNVVAGEAVGKVAPKALDIGKATVDTAKAGIEKIKPYATPKNVGRVGGGIVGGKLGTVAVPGYGTVGGAVEGAALGGKAVESLIGKERANKPFFKPTTPLGSINVPAASAAPAELPATPATTSPLGSATSPDTAMRPFGPKSEAIPEAVSESPTLDPTKERALRHVLGDYSMDALGKNKDGISAAQQLSNGTYQNYADVANYEGVLKPKSLAEKTGKEWTTADFKRSRNQHGQELNPNKEMVLRHLVDNYGPSEIAERTEGWGKSYTAPKAAPFSPLTNRLIKSLGVSERGKTALGELGLSDTDLQGLLVKLNPKELDRYSQ